MENTSIYVVITVSPDDVAQLCTRPSAGRLLAIFRSIKRLTLQDYLTTDMNYQLFGTPLSCLNTATNSLP